MFCSDAQYTPTPEDDIVLKSVALGTIRRTVFKIVGTTAATVGLGYLLSSRHPYIFNSHIKRFFLFYIHIIFIKPLIILLIY